MGQVRIVDYFSLDHSVQYERADSLFSAPSWIKTLMKSYRFSFYTVLDDRDDHCIHFCVVDNNLGKKISSLPFSDYTDIDVSKNTAYQVFIDKIKSEFTGIPIVLKTIGKAQDETSFPESRIIRNAFVHRIPTLDVDTVKANQSSSFIRNVKQAKKASITVEMKWDIMSLKKFYQLYHGLRFDKFESIPQPYSFFQNIHDEYISEKQGFILEAIWNEEVIASIIVLIHKKTLFYKFGASSSQHLELRPNNLIFDALIAHAIETKMEAIDLGLSGAGDSYKGLRRFKESMGGVPTHLTYYELANGHSGSDDSKAKKWIQSLSKELVKMRLGVEETSQLSELIYPLFA